MRPQIFVIVFLSLCLVMATRVLAAEKTITATIKSVDATKNSVLLDDIDLDVSRKTKITVDGKKGTLSDIKAGQKAKVVYDDQLEVAASITVGNETEVDDELVTAKTMKALQGEWVCTAMEEIGKSLDKKNVKEQDRRVTVKGHSWTMKRTENGTRHSLVGKFEIVSSSGHFDFIGKEAGGQSREFIGIYELEEDTLKVCYRYKINNDCTRPTKFKTDADKPNVSVFYTFKRDNE